MKKLNKYYVWHLLSLLLLALILVQTSAVAKSPVPSVILSKLIGEKQIHSKSKKYEDYFIPILDGTLHYKTVGSGPALVISNGGPGWTCEHIEDFGEQVASLGYRVIIYDQRGTGQSVLNRIDSTTVTLNLMLADVEQIRKHLNLKTWIVMGHSFGSMLSAMYAARFPNVIEKLILLSPPGTDLSFLSDYQANLNMRLSPEELANVRYWSSPERIEAQPAEAGYQQVVNTLSAFVNDKSKLPLLKQTINATTYTISVAQLVWSDLMWTNYDVSKQVRRYRNKCLVLAGRQDALSQHVIVETSNRFTKSQLHWLDECAHAIWVDQPDKTLEVINSFLKAR
jgi:proline iminopeptidase